MKNGTFRLFCTGILMSDALRFFLTADVFSSNTNDTTQVVKLEIWGGVMIISACIANSVAKFDTAAVLMTKH